MCNLYSLTKGQAAIRDWFRAEHDRTGNLPLFPGIFPDQMAPVVRNGAEGRDLAMLRWGMPGPTAFGAQPITNVRNVASPHWRPWLGPAHRCLVPATAFSDDEAMAPGRRRPTRPRKGTDAGRAHATIAQGNRHDAFHRALLARRIASPCSTVVISPEA
jgi:putative SOS response-associated peptidase YedK